jgi:catalase
MSNSSTLAGEPATGAAALTPAGTGWREVFLGGSPEAEEALIREQFVPEVSRIQKDVRRIQAAPAFARAQHGNQRVATKNARFEVVPDVPEDLRRGIFQPGKSYEAHVRFSNAGSIVVPDTAPDLRGIAFRVRDAAGDPRDFLMTSAAFSHVRDARQFMIAASALVRRSWPTMLWKVRIWRVLVSLVRLTRQLGLREALRIFRTVLRQTYGPTSSLATEQYWSRAPFAMGNVAVKYMLEPAEKATGKASKDLREELKQRLRSGPVEFEFRVQRYVDEARTPIEDATVEWKSQDTPFITLARLVIPAQELSEADEREIAAYEFSPWNTNVEDFRPIGSMNRARKLVYYASAKLRRKEGS